MTMSRLPCKWLYKTRFGCYCNCSVFFQRRNFADESHCLGCEVYEPSSVCPTCKHYDNTTDTEEEFCHALGEVIGDIAMGNSKITTCEYWCEDNLIPLNWETATRLPCEYLGFNYSQQCCICRYDVKKSIELSDLKRCFDCKNYIAVFKSHVKPKDDDTMVKVRSFCKYLDVDKDTQKFICHFTSLNGGASMILSGDTCLKCNYYKPIVCKYQNEENDCIKSSQRTFACVFAQCNAWDAAEVRCQYFEQTDESTLQTILSKIPEKDLEFLEYMFKTKSMYTLEQISLSLSSRYDP